MEEKFQSILDNYNEQLFEYEEEVANLRAKIKFYIEHKLEEELRIVRIKYSSLEMVIYKLRKMVTELEELLNNWNS